jgi:hypothetical protein
MVVRALLPVSLCLGVVAVACANEPPTVVGDDEPAKTHAVLSVERTDPAVTDAHGSASAVARFVSLPAVTDANRVLSAAGVMLDLPPLDTCQPSGSQTELEPPLPSQGGLEFVEAGDVSISALNAVTPLVPHAFPTVGGFASGVLYTTRDRASSALPAAVPYVLSATGSQSVPALHALIDAPKAPASVVVAGTTLGELAEFHTGSATVLTWAAGDPADSIYAELLAYDGSPSVLCSFRDDSGAGMIPADAFAGTGTGRIALHRVRSRHLESKSSPSSDVRFDFQVGSAVDFSR